MNESLKEAKRIVIKIGTSVLTKNDQLSQDCVHIIARQIGQIHSEGREVIVVTSGAIAAGMHTLKYETRPTDLNKLQAASAVGQWRLMSLYEQAFREQEFHAAQILLTKDDLADERKLNVSATLGTLLKAGIIPVINENDSVSTDEIRVGDNDQLAAHIAILANAQALMIVTDVRGFYKAGTSEVIPTVSRADLEQVKQWAGGTNKATSAGGMQTKLIAAELVTSKGIPLVIANGDGGYELTEVFLKGKHHGTIFTP